MVVQSGPHHHLIENICSHHDIAEKSLPKIFEKLIRTFNIVHVYQYFTIYWWYFLLKFEQFSWISYKILFKIWRYQRPFWYLVPPLIESPCYLGGQLGQTSHISSLNVLFLVLFQNLNWDDLLMKKVKPPFVPTVVSVFSWLLNLKCASSNWTPTPKKICFNTKLENSF